MRAARSLKTFPTVAVLDPEEKRPHFAEGQLVKIRNTSEEEAKRVFDASGIHWNSAKAQLLGSLGELRSVAENYYAVYTPDRSDWWRWPLSMLQEADNEDMSSLTLDRVNDFQPGHLVKIRKLNDLNEVQRLCSVSDTLPWEPNLQDEVEGVTWKPSMAQLLGSVGKVETRRKDSCRVSFGDALVWWPLTMLEAPLCPQGHLLRLATAEFHICNSCGCGLSDTAAHCGECLQHFCSHCAQEEIGQPLEVGARVRFLMNAADVCWSHCPGDSLPFLRGDLCRISQLEGEWFRSGHLWAPLRAVATCSAENTDSDPCVDYKDVDGLDDPYVDYGAEEWASTSTELKEKTPMFSLVARERLLLCESCWNTVPQSCGTSCALCHGTTNLRPSYRERWESQCVTPGLDECPKEAWPGHHQENEAHHEPGQAAIMRKQMAALVEELTRQRAEIQQLRWEKEELRRELEQRA